MEQKIPRKLYFISNIFFPENTRANIRSGVFFIAFAVVGFLFPSSIARAQSRSVVLTFTTAPTFSDEQCARALTQWAAHIPCSDVASWCATLENEGIDAKAMLQTLQWQKLTIREIQTRCYFFKDHDVKTLRKFTDFVAKHRAHWASEQRAKEQGGVACIVYHLPEPEMYSIRLFRDSGLRAIKTHGLKLRTGNIFKPNGKYNKKSKENVREHSLKVNANEAVLSLEYTDGSTVNFTWPRPLHPAPVFIYCEAAEKLIVEGNRTYLTWVVLGTDSIEVNEGIGVKPAKWQLFIAPEQTTDYVFRARNAHGACEATVAVEVERVTLGGVQLMLDVADFPAKTDSLEIRVELFDRNKNEAASWKGWLRPLRSSQGVFLMSVIPGVLRKSFQSGSIVVSLIDQEAQLKIRPQLTLNYSNLSEEYLQGFEWRSVSADIPVVFDF
jgi:hypothetical protein